VLSFLTLTAKRFGPDPHPEKRTASYRGVAAAVVETSTTCKFQAA
jgi:hypothetical protein